MNLFSQSGDDSRGVAPVTAVALGVAVALVLAFVTVAGVVSLAEDTDQDEVPPQTVVDVEKQSDGLLTIRHTGGEPIEMDELKVVGPDTTQDQFGDRTLTAGDSIDVPIEESGSASVVWESGDTTTTLKTVQTPGMGNWTELKTKLENDKHITLQRDYTPNSPGYNAMFGSGGWDSPAYSGTLEGNGHELRGIVVDHTGCFGFGFICYLGAGGEVTNLDVNDVKITGDDRTGFIGVSAGTVRNVHLRNVNIEGDNWVGGLVGKTNPDTVVEASSVDGGTVSGYGTGGLVGELEGGGIVKNSHTDVTVESTGTSGGLVAVSDAPFGDLPRIENSHASGNITHTGVGNVGGLVGDNEGYINNSYATGTVSSNGRTTGGLVGQHNTATPSGTEASIRDSYATGAVSGDDNVGALVGRLGRDFGYPGHISDSCATGSVSGTGNNVGGLVGKLGSGTVDEKSPCNP